MDLFTKLFGDFLLFVYHCFDRIVIHGYLTALSRPELVVHFFREIVGVAEVSKEALSQRTADYQNWVEAYARNHAIPIEWAEKGVRKEDHVLRWLRRMEKRNAYGVYFIFKSMEQGPTFRISLPKYPAKDPHYRIVAHQRSRFTHYYFYVRDEVLGSMVVRVASFFPFQTAYYLRPQLHRAGAEAGGDRASIDPAIEREIGLRGGAPVEALRHRRLAHIEKALGGRENVEGAAHRSEERSRNPVRSSSIVSASPPVRRAIGKAPKRCAYI